MNYLTRALVLSGMVLLSNQLGEVTGGENELLAAEPGEAPTKLAVQANSDFAFDLYQQLVKEKGDKNLFFSPYSISTALAMTAEGARGETADEMGKVLRFPTATRRVGGDAQQIPWQTSMIHTGLAELNRKLSGGEKPEDAAIRAKIAEAKKELDAARKHTQELRKAGKWGAVGTAMQKEQKLGAEFNKLASQVDQYELKVANALWGEKTYPFKQDYIDTVSGYYDTGGVFPVDFKNNFPAAKKRIDAWAAENTNDRIKEIVPKLSPDEARLMRLILTNAIYFKGAWSVPFKKQQTKDRDFTLSDGDKKQAPIMFAPGLKVGRYGAFNADGSRFNTPARIRPGQTEGCYPGADGFAMVELSYKGDDLSMVVIAPNKADGLPAIEKKLTPSNLNTWIGQLKERKTHVYLPKFKLETMYKMNDTLKSMGMPRAFTDPRLPNGADFTGMSGSPSVMDRLYIGFVVHKAFVEVNEEGTEAAAVTAVGMAGVTSVPRDIPFTPEFKADRPFIYLIREKSTGSILFLGRMMDPTVQKVE